MAMLRDLRLAMPLIAGACGLGFRFVSPTAAEFLSRLATYPATWLIVAAALAALRIAKGSEIRQRGLSLILSFAALCLAPALSLTLWPIVPPGDDTPPPAVGPVVHEMAGVLRREWTSRDPGPWPVAVLLCEIANWAYETPYNAENKLKELGFTSVHPLIHNSAVGYLAVYNTIAVVVFRGTDKWDVGDWLVNFDTSPASVDDIRVVSGFLGTYQEMKADVAARLTQHKITDVWVCGHSQGGALAVVCALDLASPSSGLRLRGLMTFGQPLLIAPGSETRLQGVLGNRFARFVFEDDVVTRVLPGYRGGGDLVWFRREAARRLPNRSKHLAQSANSEHAGSVPVAASIDDAEPVPLTDAEFEELKKTLRERHAAPQQENRTDTVDMAPVKGFLPSVSDHALKNYLKAVQRFFSASSAGGESEPPVVIPDPVEGPT